LGFEAGEDKVVIDKVLTSFLAPPLAKYGFDNLKWIVANPKR